MKATAGPIPGLLIFEPRVFRDNRGWFLETWSQEACRQHGLLSEFVQDNASRSSCGVLRGLHYQLPPHAQGKLVRVVRGRVFDVAVDLRRSSTAFGKWFGIELSEENFLQVFIPPGCAHGFLALTEDAEVHYKCTAPYEPSAERCIWYDDPHLAIAWPVPAGVCLVVSPKDLHGTPFLAAEPIP